MSSEEPAETHSASAAQGESAPEGPGGVQRRPERGDGSEARGLRRRDLFTAAGVAAATGIVGGALGWSLRPSDPQVAEPAASPSPTPSPSSPLPAAERVPGVTSPAVPQRHLLVTVLKASGDPSAAVRSILSSPPQAQPDAGELTVTFGFGAALAAALWPGRATADMTVPGFAGDEAGIVSGGDLAVQVCAETAAGVREATAEVLADLPGTSVLWQQAGYRDAPTPAGTARTSTGFIDGIANPRSAEELAEGVWTSPDRRDTYVVYRRMRIRPDFLAKPRDEQERAIGRHRDTGAPLSGGGPLDNVDLLAKAPDGKVLVPNDAHARRAHPANLGRALMLRRSYSYDPAEGAGLVFTAFLNDPQTFVATQRRLDESDAFLAHTSTDASGMFFVPQL